MPFAWRDERGRVRKLIQGGAKFIPWPIQPQREDEEIPSGSIVINTYAACGAWQRIFSFCFVRNRNAEVQRMQEDANGHDKFLSRKRKAEGNQEQGLQILKVQCEIPSRRRKITDEQEQGLQSLDEQEQIVQNPKAQDESERDLAEQGLQNLILSLPHDLVMHKVLPFLPLPKIFELRRVSREWKSLLSSPHLMRQCIAAQHGHQAWLVMAGRAPGPNCQAKEFIAYVPSLGCWIPFPFPRSSPISTILGLNSELLQENVKSVWQRNPNSILMTSAGGLICCIVYNKVPEFYTPFQSVPNYMVLVFNPLTGDMKKLPPLSTGNVRFSRANLYMLYDQAQRTYKIIVFYHLQDIHIYDSKSGCWKISYPHLSPSTGILNADLFFYATKNPVHMLHGYHMGSDSWSSLAVPAPPFFGIRTGGFFVKQLNGRVILAYSFRPNVAPVDLQGFSVWELDYSSSSSSAASWVLVSCTPSKFWNKFHDLFIVSDFADDTSFITSGQLLCMTGVDFEDGDYGGYYSIPLVYDFDLKSWYRLPPYKGSRRFMGLFSFHPTLNVPM